MPASQPWPLLTTPEDHAAALHPAGLGRVSIGRRLGDGRWSENSVPVAELAYAVRQLAGLPDVYLTQNRFFGRRRLVSRLAELDALFVDLDFYKTEHAEAHPRHVLSLALEALEAAQIPIPSFAVSSGRGLMLVWLHGAVPRAALPRWRACQQVLWHTLQHLGSDRLATDAARVLRLVGTRNSRSDTLVEGLTPADQPWNFDLLADEILPLQRAELAVLRHNRRQRAKLIALGPERARRRAEGQGTLTLARHFTTAGLWELRLAELQLLLKHRWFGALPEGQRDAWMLIAGVAMSYLAPGVVARREIIALAHEATGGRWSEQEAGWRLSAVIARALQAARGEQIEYRGRLIDPRYRYRTETIIEVLGITEAGMRACDLRHLVSPDLRREHHRIAEEQRRRSLGAVPRQDYETGSFSRLKPWEAEGISRRTWYRRHGTSPCRCMVAEPLSSGPLAHDPGPARSAPARPAAGAAA